MIKALFTSANGMQAQQGMVDNIANNIANVNTNGFKRSHVEFQDLLYQTIRAPGTQGASGLELPTGIQVGSGVRTSAISKIFTMGSLVNTKNELDMAIEGPGFLRILLPNGEFRYTRDGSIRLNSAGQMVTSDGFYLQPPISLPQDTLTVTIGTDGTVSVVTAGAPNTTTVVGTINLTRFVNPAGLLAEGRNLFRETTASGPPITGIPGQDGLGTLLQGFQERSNVDIVSELVSLITAQRAFESGQRAVRTSDQMLEVANAIVR
jgi:flagellar basal-body rod protein FlgG